VSDVVLIHLITTMKSSSAGKGSLVWLVELVIALYRH